MFSNFIYFIIVLLIYNTYQPSSEKNFPAFESLTLFVVITFAFFYFTRLRFENLEKRLSYSNAVSIDQRFTSLQTRHCIFAIGLFAVHVYILNLPAFFSNLALFKIAPTLLALFFLFLFIAYLAIIWWSSHPLYQKLYRSGISRGSYILSNISFSIPVLLPWLLLSGVADLLNALPFDAPKEFLNTNLGQAVYFIFFLFIVAILGPVMIQHFWRCKPLEEGLLRHRIETLCRKAGLIYSDILYWPIFGGRMITAGVMGLVGRFRYILVTNGLLSLLTPEEIDAVISHEIGHIKRHHLLFYLLFFMGYPFLYYAFYHPIDLIITVAGAPHGILEQIGMNSVMFSVTIFNIIMIVTFLIYFRYIFGYFMRNFERQADAYVFSLLNSAQSLISTFQKIANTSTQPVDKPNWHHYSIKERIDFLASCENDRFLINRHNRKIRLSILVYLMFLAIIGYAGYHLNFGAYGAQFKGKILERAIINEIQKDPLNPELYNAIGKIYFDQKEYIRAVRAYRKSLRLNPDQGIILNDLAWLYATCDDPKLRNPQKALQLAQKAVQLDSSPEVLDTLAESYFINGEIALAIEIEKKALAKAKDRKHYERQLHRFRQALEQ